jgi:allophanate hydrolase
MSLETMCLAFDALRAAYRDRACTPHDVVDEIVARAERDRERVRNVWLHRVGAKEMHDAVQHATARRDRGDASPLYGVPFGVKDNIDVAGVPTTVACPDLAYTPEASAPVVQRLVDAGAIFVGKLNLDQLATGLVGVRSPFGTPTNPFDARMIPGGSSSGSAVAVAAGHVSFALGTDTAGSGRVPAAFNNVVGLKPTRGVLSTRGVVPACRSFDCVTVFALTVEDACAVTHAGKGWDPLDPFSRIDAQSIAFEPADSRQQWRIGVPPREQLEFFGDDHARVSFEQAVDRFRAMGSTLVEMDLRPFREAGNMLYGGPWVVERLFAGGDLLERKPQALLPVVRDILLEARGFKAQDVFAATYRLHALRQSVEPAWRSVDALLVPTTPTVYRVEEILANPRVLNSNLGIYTTFGNLMDLAGVAVPTDLRGDGLPSGITLLGPRASDPVLVAAASAYHRRLGGRLGATQHTLPARAPADAAREAFGARKTVAVVGAHLTGQPLNRQLVGLGGVLVESGATAPRYRLFALTGTAPPKPGLVRVSEGGRAIELEIWSLDARAFGDFVSAVSRPLCIGTIELDDGRFVQGFLCEGDALADAVDISQHGGWRAYLRATEKAS